MSNKHIRNALIIAQNARKHFDDGGPVPSDSSLMDKILGGTDYVSSGGGSQGNYSQPVVTDNKVNWGNPDSSSDFFKADKAYQDLYGGNTNATSPFYTQRPSQSQSPSLIDRILGKTPASTASPAPASNSTSTPVPPTNVQNVNVPNLGNIKDISDQSTYPNAGKPLNSVDGFVFHHSAGGRNAQDVLDTLNARHLGVQYVIDRDGTIYRTLPDGSRGAHILPSSINNLSNMNTIGAEVVAKDNNDVTPAQIASGQKLFGVYKQQYPKLTAWGHGELNPNHKMADEGMAIVSAIRKGVANPTFQSSPTNLPPIQNRTFINYGTGNFARGGYATDGTVDEGVAANPALKTMDVSPNTEPTKDMTTIGAPPPASISPTTTRTPSIPNAMTSPVNVGIPNTTTAPVTGKTDSPYLSNPMANGGKSVRSALYTAKQLKPTELKNGGSPEDDLYREYMKKILDPRSPEHFEAAKQLAEKNIINDLSYSGFKQHPVMPSQVTTKISDITNAKPKKSKDMSWRQFYDIAKGGTLFSLGGDRSNIGRLTHINGKELAWPIDLHGGTKYQQEPNKGVVWANDKGAASALRNNILRAAEKGDVYGAFAPMNPEAVDSSRNMIDVLMSQIAASNIHPKHAKEFDDRLQQGVHVYRNAPGTPAQKQIAATKAAEKMVDWPGILNAKKARDFAFEKMTGAERAALTKLMDSKMWLDVGFPSVGTSRAAITDPDLLNVSKNMIGGNIVRLDPSEVDRNKLSFQHSTYDTPTAGKLVGKVPFMERHDVLPDYVQQQLTDPKYLQKSGPNAGQPLLIHPYSPNPTGRASFRGNTEMRQAIQPINTRMMESIEAGQERKNKYGFKKGGTVTDRAISVSSKIGSSLPDADHVIRQLKRGRP